MTDYKPVAELGNGVGIYVDADTNDTVIMHGDTIIHRTASTGCTITGDHTCTGNATTSGNKTITGNLTVTGTSNITGNMGQGGSGGRGQNITYKSKEEEITSLSGASVSTSGFIGTDGVVLGVTVRVTDTITGATSFSIGDGTDVDRFGANIALTSGTTTRLGDHTATPPFLYTGSMDVVLTANGSNFTGGSVIVGLYYYTLTPFTS